MKEKEIEKEEEENPAYLEGDAVRTFFEIFIRWLSNKSEIVKEEKEIAEGILVTPCLILSQLLQHAQENEYALISLLLFSSHSFISFIFLFFF